MSKEIFPFCCTCRHAKPYTEKLYRSNLDWKIWKCTLYDHITPYDESCGKWTEKEHEQTEV